MGNARLYYYPMRTSFGTTGGSNLEKVDFLEGISDIQTTLMRKVSDSVSLTGRTTRTSWSPGLKVRIILERFTDDALARDLYSFQTHAERGLHFGFASDSAKVVAHNHLSSPPLRGENSLAMGGNIFAPWESAATLTAGDIVHVASPAPSHQKEELEIATYASTTSTGSATFTDTFRYDHGSPSILRHRDFFPMLFLPESEINKPILSHDHRISWTFDMTCHLFPWWGQMFSSSGESVIPDPSNPVDPQDDAPGGSGFTGTAADVVGGSVDPDGPYAGDPATWSGDMIIVKGV